MAFHDDAFLPLNYSQGAISIPTFSTIVVEGSTGDEQRVIEWQQPRRRYEISFANRRAAEIDAFVAFFAARQGRAYGFRFRDLSDCTATQEVIGTNADGLPQLQKTYTDGGVSFVRPILKPVEGTLHVFSGGSETFGWSCDYTTGVVTGASPGDTATFTFDTPCRFDSDQMRVVVHSPTRRSYESVTLIELRQSY